jgi:hypothetical protein
MVQYARQVSLCDVDLQIIQRVLQVKTLETEACVIFPNFFRFQTIGARLACSFLRWPGLAAALLAAIAVIRIS